MSLDIANYKAKQIDKSRIKDGTFVARLVQVIELGLQEQIDYTTKESNGYKPRVMLTFEFPTERIDVDGESRPRWLGREFTLSNHEMATLPGIVKSLAAGSGETNLAKLLGAPCMIEVGSTNTGKAKILNVIPVPEGMPIGELENPPVAFDLDNPELDVFNKFPQWIKDKIMSNADFKGSPLEALLGDEDEGSDY